MEQNSTQGAGHRRTRALKLGLAAAGVAALAALLYFTGWWVWLIPVRGLASVSPASEVTIHRVQVSPFDAAGERWTGASALDFSKRASWSQTEGCLPTALRGDSVRGGNGDQPVRPEGEAAGETGQKACVRWIAWNLVRHPIGIRFSVGDGAALGDWFTKNPDVARLRSTELFQGLFHELIEIFKLRGADLLLPQFAEGFAAAMMKDILKADARVDYSPRHGRDGLVLSFAASRARLAMVSLVTLASGLVTEGFELPALPAPIWTFRLGGRKIVAAQHEGRVYLGSGLSGLLNVIADGGVSKPPAAAASVRITLHPEAWLESNFMKTLLGKAKWSARADFLLDGGHSRPTSFDFDPFPATQDLTRSLSPGVLSAIPADVLAVAALSASVSVDFAERLSQFSAESPLRFASATGSAAGVAVVWRLSSENEGQGISKVGVVMADERGSLAPRVRTWFRKEDRVRWCPRGKVWLAADDDTFLNDMMDSCMGKSRTFQTVAGAGADAQAFVGLNAPHLVRAAFAAGRDAQAGSNESSRRPQELEWQNAVESLQARAFEEAFQWPLFGFSGGVTGGRLTLKGFSASGARVRDALKEKL